jgi:hypothetical protein
MTEILGVYFPAGEEMVTMGIRSYGENSLCKGTVGCEGREEEGRRE